MRQKVWMWCHTNTRVYFSSHSVPSFISPDATLTLNFFCFQDGPGRRVQHADDTVPESGARHEADVSWLGGPQPESTEARDTSQGHGSITFCVHRSHASRKWQCEQPQRYSNSCDDSTDFLRFVGASRDVGACVTRVCIKQRAIEGRMRSWADALCEELALSLQQRGNYWKGRCQEIDKTAAKHVKKVRARKQRPDVTAMSEQREICTKVLMEQRTQFSFFIGTLMPVLVS